MFDGRRSWTGFRPWDTNMSVSHAYWYTSSCNNCNVCWGETCATLLSAHFLSTGVGRFIPNQVQNILEGQNDPFIADIAAMVCLISIRRIINIHKAFAPSRCIIFYLPCVSFVIENMFSFLVFRGFIPIAQTTVFCVSTQL